MLVLVQDGCASLLLLVLLPTLHIKLFLPGFTGLNWNFLWIFFPLLGTLLLERGILSKAASR